MDREELKDRLEAICNAEKEHARDYDQREFSKSRERAMRYFMGDMDVDTPAEPNRSRAQSNDVADTIGWMLPGIMRVFFSSDKIVDYLPEGENDVQAAEQATDVVNFKFLREWNGYSVLYDAFHDSLLMKVGIVKHYWDDNPVYSQFQTITGLNEVSFGELSQSSDVEILAHSQYEEDLQGEPYTFHDVKIRRKKSKGRIVIESIPPEELLINSDATSLENARFIDHWTLKPRSALIKMGFDREEVDQLPSAGALEFDDERNARFEDTVWNRSVAIHKEMQYIEVDECYVQFDADDDGVAEWCRVVMGGGKILDWEVWEDEPPFSDFQCEPIPHRFHGKSVADHTMDVQQVKTVVTRQFLNCVYLQNQPIKFVDDKKIKNWDQLTNPKFGENIRVNGDPNSAVMVMTHPFIGETCLATLSHFDNVIERRTGVGRSTMALDPEALQNQTASAVNASQSAGYSKIELVARNFAEGGMKRMFKYLLRLYVKHQDAPETIRLRDKWVQIDPRPWNADMDAVIEVGLGAGNRERDMMMTGQVLGVLKEFVAGYGQDNPFVTPKHIANAAHQFIKSTGLRNPDQMFYMPSDQEVAAWYQSKQEAAKQVPPEVQAKSAVEMQKVQADAQKAQIETQAKMQAMQAELDMKMQSQKQEHDLKMMEMEVKYTFELRKLEAEIQLEKLKMGAEMEKAEMGIKSSERLEGMKNGKKYDDKGEEDKAPNDEAMALVLLSENQKKMTEALAAPKRVIRDESGRVAGVETVMPTETVN